MRNVETWRPTKFVRGPRGWEGTRDAAELDPASWWTATRAVRAYASAIERHAAGRLADLGCGKVPLYSLYKPLVSHITCVDWPSSAHESAHIDLPADLNCPLPVPDASIDTIISSSVLEHIWRHDVLWSEMARMLAPGGKIILGTPFLYPLHELPHDYFRWTQGALERAAADNGLNIVESINYGGGLDVLADLTAKLVRTRSRIGARLVRKLTGAFLERGPFRRFSDGTAARMPLGHLIVAMKPQDGVDDQAPSASNMSARA